MTKTTSGTGSPAAQADEKVVEFPKAESGAEERARRLADEVERLARQSPTEWLYYLETGIAKKFDISLATMKEMIEATIKANEKTEREAKGEKRREQSSKQRRAPAGERRELIKQLATGEVQIITNCSLIAEGLDVPSVAGVILLRPTKSLALHLQQIGRALRPSPGKQRAVILDHAGNCLRHGMPDLEHPWSLDGRPKKRGRALVRRCPECGALIPIAAHECPECGADLRLEPIQPATVPDPLIELDPTTAHERWLANGPFQAVVRWAGSDKARLREVAAARGYKPGWVHYRLKAERDAADAAVLGAVWRE